MHRLAADTADVLVIGGGITGTGIARDAAMRGLRTVLVEQADLGAGTSSHSSRLIHGGLRYLEEGNLRLVYEALAERRILLDIAPHLIHPLAFVFPVHRGDRVPLWKLAAGVWLYSLLALFRNVGGHSILGKRGLLRAEPAVRERGLTGGVRYYDAQCDDARLVVATARSAIRHGAQIANYTRVEALDQADGQVRGARIRDLLSNETATVYARAVVNATGPWSDSVRRLEDVKATPVLRPTKGAHVVVSRARLGNLGAITMTSPIDGRVMFTLPWGEFAYIGTTDNDSSELPDHVTASPSDVVYLLRSANAYFPNAHLSEQDVVATWAGLRPLVGSNKMVGASHVSREHAILEGPGGMLSIVGGKLTTYRRMAAQMVDRVVQKLERLDGRRLPHRAPTDHEPLPGGEARDLNSFTQVGLDLGLGPRTMEHLLRHYGDETAAVLNVARERRSLMTPLMSEHPAIEAEVIHITRRELAQRVEDVLIRRIHLYYETANHGATAADRVAALMGEELGWDAARVALEADRYRQWLAGEALRSPDN